MSDKLKLKKFIESFKEMQGDLDKHKKWNKARYLYMLRKFKKDEKPPEDFNGSSYLYVRSFEGDNGNRPFSHVPHWVSPDIKVAPLSGLGSYTRELDAGKPYRINCDLRNAGDLHVPSAKVEFFLTTPSLGFDTRYSDLLGVTSTWMSPMSTNTTTLDHTFSNTQSGHRCLFARVFSFAPQDIPVQDYGLDPRIDRHVAQLNLNIAQQNMPYSFQLIHLPMAEEMIQIRPITEKDLLELGHPMMKNKKLVVNTAFKKFLRAPKITAKKDGRSLKTGTTKAGILVGSNVKKGMGTGEQRKIHDMLNRYFVGKEQGVGDKKKEVLKMYREMNKYALKTDFELQIPHFDLSQNEVIAFDIVNTNKVTNQVKGGIRLLVSA
ncbi:hypothetical protein [Galbibacter mesophilus]|uniref:hypothetical protein n=1 Tax=Galbibacter mesophilus TaxID=379069 RepID=UPI00191CD8A0|nr:hypothetical protein [Galbibacter mesophilus]MCM5663644.1 hypothetical protein [Galbibacter mesophilus]